MSVKFPGVNAPIPENANEKCWAPGPSDLYLSRNRPYSRGHYHEQMLSRRFQDDEPPHPGYEAGNPLWSSYSRRYGGFESDYSLWSPGDSRLPRSSSFGRFLSDRARRSPVFLDDYPMQFHYGSLPYSSLRDRPMQFPYGSLP
ncbi:hypothetical protein ACH5RR_014155 [Cinchona calisaya]|uniref:Uncharacterized protein n=1 Tax=Cinchona calisaya TaxID=153742 RepID=A0ABD3A7X1_9GENT